MKREELIFWFGVSFETLRDHVRGKKFTGQVAEVAVPVGIQMGRNGGGWGPAFVTYDTVNQKWLDLKWGDISIDLRDFWA